jgi:hypothetical protein
VRKNYVIDALRLTGTTSLSRSFPIAAKAVTHGAMEWTDQGIVLSARPHGEGGLIVALLTLDIRTTDCRLLSWRLFRRKAR